MARIPGVDADRADIILAGALILEGVAGDLRRRRAQVSEYALRRGRPARHHPASAGGSLHHLRDVSRRSVLHLSGAVRRGARALGPRRPPWPWSSSTSSPPSLSSPSSRICRRAGPGVPEAGAPFANVGLFISHTPPPPPLVLRRAQHRGADRADRRRDRDHRPRPPAHRKSSSEAPPP